MSSKSAKVGKNTNFKRGPNIVELKIYFAFFGDPAKYVQIMWIENISVVGVWFFRSSIFQIV